MINSQTTQHWYAYVVITRQFSFKQMESNHNFRFLFITLFYHGTSWCLLYFICCSIHFHPPASTEEFQIWQFIMSFLIQRKHTFVFFECNTDRPRDRRIKKNCLCEKAHHTISVENNLLYSTFSLFHHFLHLFSLSFLFSPFSVFNQKK